MSGKTILKLYVNGVTPTASRALENLRSACDDPRVVGQFEIELVDIRKYPQLAEDERIVATPTVIRKLPPPIRRVIGDLSEREQLLLGLNLIES